MVRVGVRDVTDGDTVVGLGLGAAIRISREWEFEGWRERRYVVYLFSLLLFSLSFFLDFLCFLLHVCSWFFTSLLLVFLSTYPASTVLVSLTLLLITTVYEKPT